MPNEEPGSPRQSILLTFHPRRGGLGANQSRTPNRYQPTRSTYYPHRAQKTPDTHNHSHPWLLFCRYCIDLQQLPSFPFAPRSEYAWWCSWWRIVVKGANLREHVRRYCTQQVDCGFSVGSPGGENEQRVGVSNTLQSKNARNHARCWRLFVDSDVCCLEVFVSCRHHDRFPESSPSSSILRGLEPAYCGEHLWYIHCLLRYNGPDLRLDWDDVRLLFEVQDKDVILLAIRATIPPPGDNTSLLIRTRVQRPRLHP